MLMPGCAIHTGASCVQQYEFLRGDKALANHLKPLAVVVLSVAIALLLAWAVGGDSVHVFGVSSLYVFAMLAFTVQWLAFIPAYRFQTEHYYDLTGSFTYILVVAVAFFSAHTVDALDPRRLLVSVLVFIWAGRLGTFLFRRVKRAGKDGRFDAIKPHWPRFLVTWTLQGLWVFVTLLAVLVVLSTENPQPLGLIGIFGALIWLAGFAIEVMADSQKSTFNSRPENQGKFVNIGLWRWSRHPNYFGEILLWVGVAVIAMPVLESWQWLAMLSPVFVTLLLTRVSGVPLLEKRADEKWGSDPAYQRYKAATSILIPLPPRASHD